MRGVFYPALFLLGAGAGSGAAFMLGKPHGPSEAEAATAAPQMSVHAEVRTEFDYARLNSQFVIPVVAGGKVKSLVALSLTLEVKQGAGDVVFSREPKLRDVFLRVLFDHANAGGFDGDFTTSGNLSSLRRALVDVGRQVVGEALEDVLITDIARQDG